VRSPLHQRLRGATAEAHAALERDLDWEARVATLAGYRGLLARLRGFHAACEPAIGEALADEAFFGPRRRLAKLDADLAHLGLDPAALAALPAPSPGRLDGAEAAMGALYVLEGSTLGGQVIGRHVERLHGFGAEAGCTYYRAHGRSAGAMWRAFQDRLETVGDGDAALVAGVATFEAMRVWLCAEPA